MKLVRETNLKLDKLALNKFKTMELTKIGPGTNRVDGIALKNKLQDFIVII